MWDKAHLWKLLQPIYKIIYHIYPFKKKKKTWNRVEMQDYLNFLKKIKMIRVLEIKSY